MDHAMKLKMLMKSRWSQELEREMKVWMEKQGKEKITSWMRRYHSGHHDQQSSRSNQSKQSNHSWWNNEEVREFRNWLEKSKHGRPNTSKPATGFLSSMSNFIALVDKASLVKDDVRKLWMEQRRHGHYGLRHERYGACHGHHENSKAQEQEQESAMDGQSGQGAALNDSDLHITVFKSGKATSVTSIPESAMRFAGKLISIKACAGLQAQGVDIEEVVRLAQGMHTQGTILQYERLDDDVRIVVSVGEPSQKESTKNSQATLAADLKIMAFKNINDTTPLSITTVSSSILSLADKVMPDNAREAMKEKGVLLDELVTFSTDPHARGVTILDHRDLEKGERIVISFE